MEQNVRTEEWSAFQRDGAGCPEVSGVPHFFFHTLYLEEGNILSFEIRILNIWMCVCVYTHKQDVPKGCLYTRKRHFNKLINWISMVFIHKQKYIINSFMTNGTYFVSIGVLVCNAVWTKGVDYVSL